MASHRCAAANATRMNHGIELVLDLILATALGGMLAGASSP